MNTYNDFSEENHVIAAQMLVARYEQSIKNLKNEYFDIEEIDMLVTHYVENSMFEKALEVIKKGKSIHLTCDEFLYHEANLLLALNKPSEMLLLLSEPNTLLTEEKLLLQSRAYLMLKDTSQALSSFDRLLKELYLQSESSEESILYFTEALINENKSALAIPYLKRLIDEEGSEDAEEVLLDCYQLSGNYTEAKNIIERRIKQDPCNDQLWTELGIICTQLEQTQEAISALEIAVALNPDNTTTKKALADIFMMQEKFDAALENLESIIACGETSQDILTDIAHIYYLKKQYEQSLTTYIHTILENPYSSYEYMEVARILTEKPDVNITEILQEIRSESAQTKASEETEELLRSLYQDLEQKAVESWIQKAIDLDFQHQYDFRYHYGQWLLQHNRQPEAQLQFQKAVEEDPHDVESWKALVAQTAEISEKITLLSSAVQYNFNDSELYLLLSDLLQTTGDKAQSDHYLRLALKLRSE